MPGQLTGPHDLAPVDEDIPYAHSRRIEPAPAPRKIAPFALNAGPDIRSIEQDQVGMPAICDTPALLEAIEPGRDVGELANRFGERNEVSLARVCQERGRVTCAAHSFEMRPGVWSPHDRARIQPDARLFAPRRAVTIAGRSEEDRAQIVGNCDIEQDVERIACAVARRVCSRST